MSASVISLSFSWKPIISILDGSIDGVETVHVPYLNLNAPKALSGVSNILDPRNTYKDVKQWEEKAKKLAGLYIKNFEKYCDTEEGKALVPAGPQL